VEEMAAAIRPGGAVERIDRRRCRARAVKRFSRERMVRDYVHLSSGLSGRPGPCCR
jgi:hypothetical protein